MFGVRALATGLAFAVLLLVGAAPATAAESPVPAAVNAERSTTVTGEAWSSPAFPVTCVAAGGQISCTPDDPTLVKPQQCYLGVLYAGARATLCTTYEGHAEVIRGSGGKVVLVEYGCSAGDLVCITFENAGRGMALNATAAMHLVASNMRFDTTTMLWDAATGEWSFWQWAVLIVLFGSMVWAIGAAVVSGDREQLVGAIVRTFIAIPAVPLTLWLSGHLLNAIDDMTWYILNRSGPTELFATLQSVMWAGGQANYFFAFLIHGLILIGMLLLALVFAFRNIVLAALIAVGPIAWMLFPVRGIGPQWVVRYVSAVVVLLLTGPLTVGFVTLIINGLASVKTIWDPQSWPLLVGLVLVAFAPFAIFGLFSFVGAVAADGVGSRIGTTAGRLGAGATRAAVRVPTRLGASPAGVVPGRPAPSTAGRPSFAQASTPSRALSGAAGPAGRATSGPSSSPPPSTTASAAAPIRNSSPAPTSPAPHPRPAYAPQNVAPVRPERTPK
jgi:hypothetical protein